ncbi:MAG: hypothetical protein EOP54_08570 [Sphingobacteriales bacterium]|nr:MAG: hypothetical protein EOP54_08570 [Sphingobacteriales bacterium]
MDIAKYIGLFLVKYQYCNLPNLGDFAVVKKAASYSDGQVKAPEYEVKFAFSGGLIDDAFPNFIATNERTSIANAANAVKDFCTQTKLTLAEGGTVVIPGFGKFVQTNGKNDFIPDQNIHVETPGIPIFKINTAATRSSIEGETIAELHEKMKLKEPSLQDDIVIKPPKINWSKVVVLLLIVGAVVALVGVAIWYMNNNKEQSETTAAPVSNAAPPAATPNTNAVDPDTTVQPVVAAGTPGSYTFAILNFKDKESAEKKEKQLKGFGHDVALNPVSDSNIILTITLPAVSDTLATKDSLRRFFNPRGEVNIVK